MLLGAALVVVGAAVLYYAVTGKDPRTLLAGGLAAPRTAGPTTPRTVGSGEGTLNIRIILVAARAVPGWKLGRICGVDTVPGTGVSEHVYCNAADLIVSSKNAGDRLAAYLRAAAASGVLPIHCIIWWGRIASRKDGFAWRPYTGPNPHRDHVHVSAWPSVGGAC
jgi:hypothetical protein